MTRHSIVQTLFLVCTKRRAIFVRFKLCSVHKLGINNYARQKTISTKQVSSVIEYLGYPHTKTIRESGQHCLSSVL